MKLLQKPALVLERVLSPVIPDRYRLPVGYYIHLLNPYENELKHLHCIGPNEGIAIDVGANDGMFAYNMAQHYKQVYAFEINPDLTRALEAYDRDNIHVENKGLSSTSGRATLHIPVVNGKVLTGWATLDPEVYPSVQDWVRKEVAIARLDDYALKGVSFIKIDVEGHELEVLRGAEQTILENRPHMLVEVKRQHLNEAWQFFARRNYDMKRLDDLIGVPPSGGNFIFVPRELQQ